MKHAMKNVTWIPVISICAAFALTACDQPQTPPGQPSGTANEQIDPTQNMQGQDQGQSQGQGQGQSQSGSGSQTGNASQSSIDTDPAGLARGVALLDGTPSDSSTRWTLISDPVERAAVPGASGRSN